MSKYSQATPQPSVLLKRNFPHAPTRGQESFFQQMDAFLGPQLNERPTFLLKGYAGTGKTSVISALVRSLPQLNFRSLMMAPTGRAAKVMMAYTGKSGYTIHKIIYKPKGEIGSTALGFELLKNYYKQTIFVVDEASMLSDDGGMSGNLLMDLIQYVFQDSSNRLLLVGDSAQLPPVGSKNSPALDKNYLIHHYRLDVLEAEFTEVMRQEMDSGILYNATQLRNQLLKKDPTISFVSKDFPDFFKMTGEKLEDGLRYAYDKFGMENTIIITRSNRAAVQYNLYIRQSMFFYEDEISVGDLLMIVKNNYTFMADSDKVNFLANGDFAEIMKIRSFEDLYGLRFATVELRLTDYPEEPSFEAKIVLDTLYSHSAALGSEQSRDLYTFVADSYADVESKKKRMEAIRKDPYLTALQVKFAYALTCHKSQGGQWRAVFVDQGYLSDEQLDTEYVRWLYTAMTRASKELFMVNFHPKFFINKTNTD